MTLKALFKHQCGYSLCLLLLYMGLSLSTFHVQAQDRPNPPSTTLTHKNIKEYEAQLSAIRQAILEATIDRPTRVISTSWMDDKGALHEDAQFLSEAQVREVRITSHQKNGEEPQTKVSAEVLPWGWKPKPDTTQACSAPPRPWRLPLYVQVRTAPGFTGAQNFASLNLLNSAHRIWMEKMQISQRWHPLRQSTPAENTYLKTLTGGHSNSSGWTAEIVLKPHAIEQAPSRWISWLPRISATDPAWRWTLTLTLGQRHNASGPIQAQWQVEQIVTISPQAIAQNPGAWLQQLQNELQPAMQSWVDALDRRTLCEPLQFHVQHTEQDGLVLQAGLESGLRTGDRVLIVNPAHVPGRVLEPGAAQHLALAQVVKIGPEKTELKQLAGPVLATSSHWMALPL